MSNETQQHAFLGKYFDNKSFSDVLLAAGSKKPDEIRMLNESIEAMQKGERSSNLTYTQIRNILQLVKGEKFEKGDPRVELFRILPKLAYIEARLKENEGRNMASFIRLLASSVQEGQYEAFVDVMDAMVAYHKLHVKS